MRILLLSLPYGITLLTMRTLTLYSLGSLPAFNKATTDSNYWQERLNYEISYNLYQAVSAGFVLTQEQSTDTTTALAAIGTYSSTLKSWFTSAVSAQASGSTVPAIPALPSLLFGLSPQTIILAVAQIGFEIFMRWLEKKFDGTTDTGELVSVLSQALLRDDGDGLYSILDRGLLSNDPDGSGISTMLLLSYAPIEIQINRSGEIESVTFNSTD